MSVRDQVGADLAPTSVRALVTAGIDAAVPLIGFLAGYELWNVAVGAALGVLAALVIAAIRWRRGESMLVVLVATVVVVASAVIAAVTGQGRGFFILTAVGTTFGVAACIVSLPLRRPATGVIARWLRLELPDWHLNSLRYRLHRRLTWLWLAYWGVFAAAIDGAFAAGDVAWLTFDDTVMKLSVLVMLAVTVMIIRRPAAAPEPASDS